MSIFYSPDEPKFIDSHTGRMTRIKSRSQGTFSREKDNTILIKNRQYLRSTQVIHECTELRALREAYDVFISMFAEFNKQNGPNITGNYMSSNFLHFKAAFEPFLMHASHYFNSAEHCHAVRRYSPLLNFSAKVLREWAILVSTMNKIAQSAVLPHLHVLQNDYEMLNEDVSNISNMVVNRAYYRDALYSASNFLKHQILSIYQMTYDVFAHEQDKGFHKSQLSSLKKQVVLLCRDINDNFLALLPNAATATPEMTRTKTHMKAACGDIVALLEAGYFFRRRMDRIQTHMCALHISICSMFDRLQIKYEIDVEPIGSRNPNDNPSIHKETDGFDGQTNDVILDEDNDSKDNLKEENINEMVNDIGEMLCIDVRSDNKTVEKLSTIKKTLKRNGSPLSKTSNLSRVGIPPPIRSRLAKTALSTPRKGKIPNDSANFYGNDNVRKMHPSSANTTPPASPLSKSQPVPGQRQQRQQVQSMNNAHHTYQIHPDDDAQTVHTTSEATPTNEISERGISEESENI